MQKLVGVVQSAPSSRGSNDDDICDRLSSRYTVVILVVFALFVMANQFVSKPMTCWAPVHFKGSHTKFATNYCWIKNTYYLPWDKNVPSQLDPTVERQMITYYQWIPFILIGQAILFYLPSLVWHGFNSRAGVDADSILSSANTLSRTDMVETRGNTLKMLTGQMNRFLNNQNQSGGFSCDCKSLLSATCCRLCGKRLGNYLLLLFLFSKVCYIGNAIGQLFLLNVVLSTKYNTFGFDIVHQMVQNKTTWLEDSYVVFPRVTLCDFEIRGQDMANVHRYTLQCVLPFNLFNEKIYIFLWYWMVFVACASSVNLFLWLLRAIFRRDRTQFIKNHLSLNRINYNAKDLQDFVGDYLRQDGCMLLRLIAHNTDNITTTEIIGSLWEACQEAKNKDKKEVGDKDKEEVDVKDKEEVGDKDDVKRKLAP